MVGFNVVNEVFVHFFLTTFRVLIVVPQRVSCCESVGATFAEMD